MNSCRGEIVAREHWCSSGFANTDLDLQLKKNSIHQLIIRLIALTCIEATVRFAADHIPNNRGSLAFFRLR
jgi:nicotinamidase-related amidase